MSKTTRGIYTDDFKWKVVKEVLEGRMTKDGAQKAYGIKSKTAILYWMRKYSGIVNYREGGLPLGQTVNMANMKDETELRARIKALEQQVIREQSRADLWLAMIEVAEAELGIEIKKKCGVRQLSDAEAKGKRGIK
jgi:transposase-like protein